ncbi:Phosphoethanolamine N-methyltransferase 1 [Caenorhabditis elegans]|uniref:Isoform 2 of Phosphoethanolamine N-methyltransferase 1 n=2 Tax=Caenorhabditis elegans TaxID=6239 RepID=Q23552-2|nr:Phosphoethanolamine N-methyltransferase 1 [Caenorhabditis elegans]CCD68006.1 Phosphoethanolamine N-methyltransferase 1 [Caenorhabditis elegans]|eukprot:NP_494991.1 Phosphoethanolamine MethylTransferase [Caenorhabditis elegans]
MDRYSPYDKTVFLIFCTAYILQKAMVNVRRANFKSFWDKYSDKPDTNSMMLNHSAEELESSDRADILASLPLLHNKDVVDIGAGIGRFTTVLAETARWVLSTDFIDSFIKKNQERNAHLGNINYQVGDAVGLKMESNSVDLVFTNWLMMYLSDEETVEFIFNCMRWLRSHGIVHLRESCSEPSTGRSKAKSMHDTANANPTHYRFSSLYINLLRAIRYRDVDNKLWRFNVQWSCSVPTYIKRSNNWRQVHWLAEKVPAEDGAKGTSFNELVELIKNTWQNEQEAWDAKLDDEKYVWTDKVFSSALTSLPSNSTFFLYTPRTVSPYCHINAHTLAETFNANVWNTEIIPEYYRTSLTKSNNLKDQRVRFGWNQSLTDSVTYWQQKDALFDVFVATEFLSTVDDETIRQLPNVMSDGAKFITLEPVDEVNEAEMKQRIQELGYTLKSFTDVTDQCIEAQEQYFKDHEQLRDEKVIRKNWVLLELTH